MKVTTIIKLTPFLIACTSDLGPLPPATVVVRNRLTHPIWLTVQVDALEQTRRMGVDSLVCLRARGMELRLVARGEDGSDRRELTIFDLTKDWVWTLRPESPTLTEERDPCPIE